MSPVETLADAIRDVLNGAAPSFSQSFNAERLWRPRRKLPQQGTTIYVTVVPKSDTGRKISRSQWEHEPAVDVAIQRWTGDDEEAIGVLVDLAHEINRFFEIESNRATLPAKLTENTVQALYDPKLLDTAGIFTSAVTLSFHTIR